MAHQFTHRHADGGIYAYLGEQAGKHPDTGEWLEGVSYAGVDGETRWTTKERWAERFEELPPTRFTDEQVIELKDEDDEVVCQYAFHVEQIDDVRHLLISAAGVASKQRDHHVETVLKAQAEMVSQGLHLRDIDFLDPMADIQDFHQKFGLEYTGKPRVMDKELFKFRVNFIKEELEEYLEEQPMLESALDQPEVDHRRVALGLHQQLDALVDLTYVVLGLAYLQFGPRIFREAWRRVQAANMAKVRCEREEDSKRGSTFDVIKPEGWEPPDHHDLVADHAHKVFRKGDEDLNPSHAVDTVPTAQ
jgi:predicted HAD superfamily Cof-like phosphohydrolase